jgi:hypothetical protein
LWHLSRLCHVSFFRSHTCSRLYFSRHNSVLILPYFGARQRGRQTRPLNVRVSACFATLRCLYNNAFICNNGEI